MRRSRQRQQRRTAGNLLMGADSRGTAFLVPNRSGLPVVVRVDIRRL
ncbi:hypothetical protein AB0945_43775 [Streptomyces sp. NPDC005474]